MADQLAALLASLTTADGEYGEVTTVQRQSCTFSSALRLNAVTADVHWTLGDFAALAGGDRKRLLSADFDVMCGDYATKWYLSLTMEDSSDVHIALVARAQLTGHLAYVAHRKVSLADGVIEQDSYDLAPDSYRHGTGRYFGELVSLDTLMSRCVKDDQLVVKVTVTVYHAHAEEDAGRQMATLATLYEQRAGDFVIRCGQEDVRVFKALLIGASPVFSAMLATDMREAKESVLKIDDMTADTVRSLVKYLYTGRIAADMDASALLIAADKYQMEPLKKQCVQQLQQSLSADNAFALFGLAKAHNATELKDAVLKLIVDQLSAAADAVDDWKTRVLPTLNELFAKKTKKK